MARKPETPPEGAASKQPPEGAARPKTDPRNGVVDALLALCAEKAWDAISLEDIATRAGLSLADLRDLVPSKGAILGGFIRRIDRIVLEQHPDPGEAGPRERVGDLVMRRFAALAPYRAALRSIHAGFAHDVMGLAALNSQALNSWRYLLASIHLETEGMLGYARLQGTVLMVAAIFPTFLVDESEDLAATRALLEVKLGRAEWLMRRAEGVEDLLTPIKGFFNAWRETRARQPAPRPDEPAAGPQA